MLAGLVRFSIRFCHIIVALAVLILLYGSYRFSQAGLDIFPEFSPKRVIIQTESPGLSTEQVEVLVTRPIETAISGLIGLENVRSESIQGLSIITATFVDHSDIYLNRQLISERLAGITAQLPPLITPVVVPLSSSSATVMTIGLSDNNQDQLALRSLVDWLVVPRLMAVPGVADVNVFGGDIRQLQIQVDPIKLRLFEVSMDEVLASVSAQTNTQGGGFLENDNQRFSLQISGQAHSPDEFKEMLLNLPNPDRRIKIGDIASVQYAPEPAIGAAQIMGNPGIVMMVIGQYDANTLTVSKQVEQALQELEPVFKRSGLNFYPHLFRPADYIERSHSILSSHLLLGGLFVLIVLYIFLFNVRTAFISAIAIPVSLIGAVMVLLATGVNLNIMVLGGLAIALGEVVDDAIIDTENIFRRLRENRRLPTPLPVAEVVYKASLEVRSSVVYASFIVALVFVPLLTLSGVAGRLFAPLGYSYILAILTSLLVALTLTPALCYMLLGKTDESQQQPPVINFLLPIYHRLALATNRHFKTAVVASLLVCGLGIAALMQQPSKFLPELREGHFIVHTSSIPGTSLAESLRIGTLLTNEILKIPGVQTVSQWAGRAERGADTYGSHYSEYEVRLQPLSGKQQQILLDALRELLEQFPGINSEANTFLTERVDETISGYTSPVVVNIYGTDLSELDSAASDVAEVMADIAGADNVQLRSSPAAPMLHVQLHLPQLSLYGVQPQQITDLLQSAYETKVVGKQIYAGKTLDIAVTIDSKYRQLPEFIGQLPIRTNNGGLISLQQVAEVRFDSSRYNILHQGGQRRQTVTCNIEGRDFGSFMAELKTKVGSKVQFPKDTYPEYTGAALEQAKARDDLILHALLAGAGVLLLIFIAIGNFRHVLLTLVNLPFALIGGVAAVLITDASLSVGSVVGFITLFGITVRNSIMLLSHYQHLLESEGKVWHLETALAGAQQRLPSILMTALVTALAMLPIAFDSDNPGREIMGPMAAIIIGGLASSTILNLLLMPLLLVRFARWQVGSVDK